MLDRYVFGKVNRVSPEAPVPVFLSEKKKEVLGGAGNVFNNLVSLGVFTTLITVIGSDAIGDEIKKNLKKNKKSNKHIFIEKKKSTSKTRYLVNGQQLIRVDEENKNEIDKQAYSFILKFFKKEITKHDIVVLSDYNKGIFSTKLLNSLIKISNQKKTPIIIDPKNKNFDAYKNSTLITPNLLETSQVTNLNCDTDKEAEKCGKIIMKKYKIKNVLITRGEKGLSYINHKNSIHSSTKKIEVFDVSGAGDTVLAIISICFANNIDIKESLNLANKAAGSVVGKIGTSVIKKNELFKDNINNINKIINIKDLKTLVEDYKKNNLTVGFTNGCFDILHYGHIKYLEETKKLCDKLIIAINSDKSVKKIKGTNRPINNEMVRAKILASLIICDHVVIFNEDTPIKIIRTLKPDLLTKGSDYKKSEIVGAKDVRSWNGRIETIKLLKKFSSTKIINGLK